MLVLKKITNDNFHKVLKLQLLEGEDKFVANNYYSIAQAYVEKNTSPRAIHHNDTVVGFTLYGQFEEDKGDYWIARLMIDKNHRRKGFAEKAMLLAIAEMATKSDCDKIFISFVPENKEAEKLYEKLGFVDTQKRIDGEIVYVLEFA